MDSRARPRWKLAKSAVKAPRSVKPAKLRGGDSPGMSSLLKAVLVILASVGLVSSQELPIWARSRRPRRGAQRAAR